MQKVKTKTLVYMAVAISLATILSFVKILHLPMGGSVTLCSMFMVSVLGFWFGAPLGILSGIVYGFLQLAVDPYVVHPMQLLLDYPIAYGALGLSGFFIKQKYGLACGFAVSCLGRWFFTVISGCVFFSAFAPQAVNFIWYAMFYNGSYIGLEMIITLFIISIPAVHTTIDKVKQL